MPDSSAELAVPDDFPATPFKSVNERDLRLRLRPPDHRSRDPAEPIVNEMLTGCGPLRIKPPLGLHESAFDNSAVPNRRTSSTGAATEIVLYASVIPDSGAAAQLSLSSVEFSASSPTNSLASSASIAVSSRFTRSTGPKCSVVCRDSDHHQWWTWWLKICRLLSARVACARS